jgi:hypothetical protein
VAHAAVVQDLELATYLTSVHRTIYVAPFANRPRSGRAGTGAESGRAAGDRVRILHAPSDRFIKGSAAIEEIVGSLEAELPIESISGWRTPRCSRPPPGRTS